VADIMYVARNLSMLAINMNATSLDDDVYWSVSTEAPISSSPVYAGGILYFGSGDGSVYAVRTNGPEHEVLWTFDTGGEIVAPVAVIDGAVIATNILGDIVVIGGEASAP